MDRVDVEVYSRAGNWAVLRLPGRRFPGVYVQGDTLATYCQELDDVQSELAAGDLEGAAERLDSVRGELQGLLAYYMSSLMDAGEPLPFVPPERDGARRGHTPP